MSNYLSEIENQEKMKPAKQYHLNYVVKQEQTFFYLFIYIA